MIDVRSVLIVIVWFGGTVAAGFATHMFLDLTEIGHGLSFLAVVAIAWGIMAAGGCATAWWAAGRAWVAAASLAAIAAALAVEFLVYGGVYGLVLYGWAIPWFLALVFAARRDPT